MKSLLFRFWLWIGDLFDFRQAPREIYYDPQFLAVLKHNMSFVESTRIHVMPAKNPVDTADRSE